MNQVFGSGYRRRAREVLDVRSPSEWHAGSGPGAVWRYVPDQADGVTETLPPDEPVWVLCASGFRGSLAAGLLQQQDYRPIVLADGGLADVLRRLPAAT